MTEKEKMLSGNLYSALDRELTALRKHAEGLFNEFNNSATTNEKRQELFSNLVHTNGQFDVRPPFYCDYGFNITVGDNFFANFNCVILDVCKVTIGSNVLIAPNVQIYTAFHPLQSDLRAAGIENGKPITIGNNVWIGGGAIILPGVTIGDNSVIGAGSIVTKDIPDNCLAFGNPARVVKHI